MYFRIIIIVLILCANYVSCSDFDKQYGSLPEIFHLDNYDNCMMRGDEALYCRIEYHLEPINEEDTPEIWQFIKEISSSHSNYDHSNLRHFICVPLTCPGLNISDTSENNPLFIDALEKCYNVKYKHLHLKGTIKKISCETNTPKHAIGGFDILYGIVLAAYISFIIFATFFEVTANHKSPEEYQRMIETPKGRILAAFSLHRNWIRLKTVNFTPESSKLRSIHGLRVLNSALVVMAHTVLAFIASPLSNTREAELIPEKPSTIIFTSGHLCLSVFFFISSFLLANELFAYLKDKESLTVKTMVKIFLFRVTRLLPSLFIVVLFHSTWLYHLGKGPIWNTGMEDEYLKCRKNGWTNLLFLNNMINPDQMCLPVTWSLALSMQYFVLSLFFIRLLKKYEKYIWHILGATIACNIFGTFLQHYYYDFPALLSLDIEMLCGLTRYLQSDLFVKKLGSFVMNLEGSVCGIAFGYYYYKLQVEKPGEKIFTTKLRMCLFWFSLLLGVSCLAVPGVIILYISNEHDRFWAAVYVALSVPIMAISAGIFILGCSEGVGGILKRISEWPPTYILSRLTYSVYLVHMSISMLSSSMLRQPDFLSNFSVVHRFIGDLALSYIMATLLTLFVELPVSALQKIQFARDKKLEKNE